MAFEVKKNLENNEIKNVSEDEPLKKKKLDANIEGPFDPHGDEKDGCESLMKRNTIVLHHDGDSSKLRKWRKKKITINKSLFAFRITQSLWFGAGALPSIFLGIFFKHRGLTIVEISSVYSMIFLFQFITCFITGIISDKTGNAKPVLMSLILLNSCVLVSISLTPAVSDIKLEENLNISNIEKFNSCCINCLFKNKTHLQIQKNFTGNSMFENDSFVENSILSVDNDKTVCNFCNISFQNTLLDSSEDDCYNLCACRIEDNPVTREYLVAIYAALILTFYSVWSTTYRFMDFTTAALAAKNDSHFGRERIFPVCSELFVLILTGFVLTLDESSESQVNFDSVIWISAGIMFCAFLTLFMTEVPIFTPGKHLMKKAYGLMKDIDILAFILLVFVAGNGYAFNLTFHLVFLEGIHIPSIVVALHSVAIVLYGLPFLLTSNWWLGKLGANTLFVLCLLFYAINSAAFSFIYNPWYYLIIDITVIFSDYLFWVAVVLHCQDIAPAGFAATLNAVTGSVHFGMGRSSGVFFGGMMINYMGPRKTNRIFAAIFLATAILYSVYIYKRRRSPPNVAVKGNETVDARCSKNTDT